MKKSLLLFCALTASIIANAQTADLKLPSKDQVEVSSQDLMNHIKELENPKDQREILKLGYDTRLDSIGKLLTGCKIKFPSSNTSKLENFYSIPADTLWVNNKKKKPQQGKDYYVFNKYKAIDEAKGLTSSEISYRFRSNSYNIYSRSNYFITTPASSIMDKEFVIIKCSHKPESIYSLFSIEIQSVDNAADKAKWVIELYKYSGFDRNDDSRLFSKLTFIELSPEMNKLEDYIKYQKIAKIAKDIEDAKAGKRAAFENKKAEGKYTFFATKVEKPSNSQIKYGKTSTVKDDEKLKYLYEDNVIRILWIPTKNDFSFILNNKSNYSLKIIWDEAVIISEQGFTNKTIHNGIKYSEKSNSQPPTVIPKDASLTDLLSPTDKIRYSDILNSWIRDPLLSDSKKNENIDNKTMKVVLPIQIQGITNEYVFTFKIKWEPKYPELQNVEYTE